MTTSTIAVADESAGTIAGCGGASRLDCRHAFMNERVERGATMRPCEPWLS
jgi:hypothetical protein